MSVSIFQVYKHRYPLLKICFVNWTELDNSKRIKKYWKWHKIMSPPITSFVDFVRIFY